jgi:(S)-ureidoglycine aminohydrolase
MSKTQSQKLIVSDADVTSRCRCVNIPGSYMIFPRANRVEHQIPGFKGVQAQVLATPQLGAKFVQHELLVEANGGTDHPVDQNFEQFLFVQEGEIDLHVSGKNQKKMMQGSFCWLPPQQPYEFVNKGDSMSRVIWIRRRFLEIPGVSIPEAIIAHESDVQANPTDTYMEQHLTPYEQIGFDMGINLQTFDPGSYFSFVESHVMEHGLYMLSGRGIYWLNHDYIEVQKDDFIYMAPFCPQFYYSTGWEKSSYLLYKDVNRDYVHEL